MGQGTPNAGAEQKLKHAARKRRTVLIIDDQESIRELIKTILGEFGGWRTIEAATSQQGLAVARNRRVDLVLSDIVRPGKLNGLELLEVFKVSHPDIPVIMVSGNSDPALRLSRYLGGSLRFRGEAVYLRGSTWDCRKLLVGAARACRTAEPAPDCPKSTEAAPVSFQRMESG